MPSRVPFQLLILVTLVSFLVTGAVALFDKYDPFNLICMAITGVLLLAVIGLGILNRLES